MKQLKENPLFDLLENSIEGYIIFQVESHEILYQNKLAQDFFSLDDEAYNKKFFDTIKAHLKNANPLFVPEVALANRKGITVFCSIEACNYQDDQHISCKITAIENEILTKKAIGREDIETIPLSAILRLTTDILFHIDLETKVLTHAGDLVRQFGLPKRIENFPTCITEGNVIHPDDMEDYLIFAHRMDRGIGGRISVRIKLLDETFEWFQIDSTPIFDRQRKPIEILGKLKNIHTKKLMEGS